MAREDQVIGNSLHGQSLLAIGCAESKTHSLFFNEYKTISDGCITLDFWIIKVLAIDGRIAEDHQIAGEHRIAGIIE